MNCNMPGFPILHHVLEFKLMFTESVTPSNYLLLCYLPLLLPSIFASIKSLFQRVGSSHQVTKALMLQHQSFQFRVDFL